MCYYGTGTLQIAKNKGILNNKDKFRIEENKVWQRTGWKIVKTKKKKKRADCRWCKQHNQIKMV